MKEGSRFAPMKTALVHNNRQISINDKENCDEESFTT